MLKAEDPVKDAKKSYCVQGAPIIEQIAPIPHDSINGVITCIIEICFEFPITSCKKLSQHEQRGDDF